MEDPGHHRARAPVEVAGGRVSQATRRMRLLREKREWGRLKRQMEEFRKAVRDSAPPRYPGLAVPRGVWYPTTMTEMTEGWSDRIEVLLGDSLPRTEDSFRRVETYIRREAES
jgi:hypothetical protein